MKTNGTAEFASTITGYDTDVVDLASRRRRTVRVAPNSWPTDQPVSGLTQLPQSVDFVEKLGIRQKRCR